MRRTIVAVLIGLLGFSGPALAGPISNSVKNEAARMFRQRTAISRYSTNAFFWSGIAFSSVGATLAILGSTVSKSSTPESSACETLGRTGCDAFKNTNKGMLWTGLGIVGAGVGLIAIGAANSSVEFGPDRIAVTHRVGF